MSFASEYTASVPAYKASPARYFVTAYVRRRPIFEETTMTENKAKDEAADTRPVPSQAEGEEETVDKSLKQKEQKEQQEGSNRQ